MVAKKLMNKMIHKNIKFLIIIAVTISILSLIFFVIKFFDLRSDLDNMSEQVRTLEVNKIELSNQLNDASAKLSEVQSHNVNLKESIVNEVPHHVEINNDILTTCGISPISKRMAELGITFEETFKDSVVIEWSNCVDDIRETYIRTYVMNNT